jgi:hypothetical protein
MKVAVAGGTGVAGRWAVEALRAGGHEATVIARSAGVDLVTGNGLAAALAGIDAVIDATNVTSMGKRASTEFFEATARTLTRTAAGAGVRHILGVDHVARFLLGVLAKEQPGDMIDQVAVNGALGFAVYQQGELVTVVSVTVAGGRVARLDLVRAPGKLPRLAR